MPQRTAPAYLERLRVPIGIWLIILPIAAVLGLELAPLLPWDIMLTTGSVVLLAAALLFTASLGRIVVTDGRLLAPGIDLECTRIAAVEELDRRNTRSAMTVAADPRATMLVRPWLRTTVRILPVDENPPYFLIGTRNPTQLADALVACAEAATDEDSEPQTHPSV